MTKLTYTPPPHLKAEDSVSKAMLDVIIALLPVTIFAILYYRGSALLTIVVCLIAAALTEVAFRKAFNKKPSLNDFSALLTGLLVALCLPPAVDWWIAALATFIGVGIGKELVGGLGLNRFNPALLGRVSVFLIPSLFYSLRPLFQDAGIYAGGVDAVTQGTPLAMSHQGADMSILQLLAWNDGGALVEVSPLMVIIGGAYLLYRGHISWRIPATMIATVFVLSILFMENPVNQILLGGVMLGAFFMATDWVTSPITDKGKIIFGIVIGVLVIVFRFLTPAVEGVAFAILIMNAFVPLIEKMTKRPSFSEPKATAATAGKGTAAAR